MSAAAGGTIFCRQITEQTDVKKIGRLRQKLERPAVLLGKRTGVIPDPADPVLFEKVDNARQVPFAFAKFHSVTEPRWKMPDEIPQRRLVLTDGKSRRQLN